MNILKFCGLGLVFLFGIVAWTASPRRFFNRRNSPIISFNLDEKERVNSAVRVAAREDRLEDLKDSLAIEGANINSQSEDGVTALMYASRNCYPKVVRYLISNGADVNLADKAGRSALMYATRALCLPAVKAILANPHLKIRQKDHRGRSAMGYARAATALEVDGPAIEILRLLKMRLRSTSRNR